MQGEAQFIPGTPTPAAILINYRVFTIGQCNDMNVITLIGNEAARQHNLEQHKQQGNSNPGTAGYQRDAGIDGIRIKLLRGTWEQIHKMCCKRVNDFSKFPNVKPGLQPFVSLAEEEMRERQYSNYGAGGSGGFSGFSNGFSHGFGQSGQASAAMMDAIMRAMFGR